MTMKNSVVSSSRNPFGSVKYHASIASIGLLALNLAEATEIEERFNFGFQMPGTALTLDLEPPLPVRGEAFQIIVSGVANRVCPPINFDVATAAFVENSDFDSPSLRISADNRVCETRPDGTTQCGNFGENCDLADLPIAFSEALDVPVEFWNTLPVEADALTLHLVVSTGMQQLGSNPPVLDTTTAMWTREVDLLRGTHVIQPKLEAGLFVSDDHPREGVLVQQQGDRVVFYELTYGPELNASGDAFASWRYADATLSGNSGNGVYLKLSRPHPEMPDVIFETYTSSSIIVDDINQLRLLFDAAPRDPGVEMPYSFWRRWSFNQQSTQRPVLFPDFSGSWNLLRFAGATELAREPLTFDEGKRVGAERWQFQEIGAGGFMTCEVNSLGRGSCELSLEDSGAAAVFPIEGFNGNLAEGLFLPLDGANDDAALLLRQPLELPGDD
ncbi:MAG: hypothetical protein V2I57_00705 [Xanthomonadales bacterium]|jgi:hypothetical protein|nr:hypothetical protein [Xanthomonadales bacterium]